MPESEILTTQTYLDVLLDQAKHKVQIRNLRMDRNRQMARQHMDKKGLSDISVKVHVDYDKITCSALKQNGKYM